MPQYFPCIIAVVSLQSVHISLSQPDILFLLPAVTERECEVLPVVARAAVREGRHQDVLDVFRQWDTGRG